MYKIIEEGSKFRWKQYDQQGNSVAVSEFLFDTMDDCEKAIAILEGRASQQENQEPQAPAASEAPVAPEAPATPTEPEAPTAPEVPVAPESAPAGTDGQASAPSQE